MNNADKLKDYYDISHQFLRHGIDLDERKRYFEAYEYYIEGLKAIEEGLNLKFTTNDWNQKNFRENYETMTKLQKTFGNRSQEINKMKQQQEYEKLKKQSNSQEENGGFFNYLYQTIVGDPSQQNQTKIQPQQNQYQPQFQQNSFDNSSNIVYKSNETKPYGQYNIVHSNNSSPQQYQQTQQYYQQQQDPTYPFHQSQELSNSSNVIFKPVSISKEKQSELDKEVEKLRNKYSSSFTIQPRNSTSSNNSIEDKLDNAKKNLYQPKIDNSIKQNIIYQKKMEPTQKHIQSLPNQIETIQKKKPVKKLRLNEIPELKNVDNKLLDTILNEIIDNKSNTKWSDIAGLKDAKQSIYETIILPTLKPDFFTGIRAPARGILLFGPPGNGKTLLAKAIANECEATFFNISASSLVSKWHGEGEKLVRALFAAARYLQPSIIFIDEIDSILTSRTSSEHDASRRMKTEFLVQMDGVSNLENDKVVLMGATNVPFELDEAILRRFPKKILIPLPDKEARIFLISTLLKGQKIKISKKELHEIADLTENYSGSDLKSLCKETSMIPIRELGNQIMNLTIDQIRPIDVNDFYKSIKSIKPNTTKESIKKLDKWNKEFGNF
eukprot:gene925-9834_t